MKVCNVDDEYSVKTVKTYIFPSNDQEKFALRIITKKSKCSRVVIGINIVLQYSDSSKIGGLFENYRIFICT